ncbi:hypothetical protein [uncultured Sulfitobacter sp.]|uniref:hypothetical protein n=1 Tax=uncultured Sulfitobacter sp. TaxID=191468 RepID=UPI00262CF670|nr:hypothetical protein [uncultured Sulfitobacter sp.]
MSDDDFTTEIVLRSGEHEAKLPAIPQPILQALHNSLIGVEESHKTRLHFPSMCVAEDIEQLVHLLSQWIETYGPLSQAAKITCVVQSRDKLKGNKRLSYVSMGSFLQNYPGITDATSSVIITFSAVLKLPDRDVLDKINLEVDLRSTMPSGYVENYTKAEKEDDFDLPTEMHYPSDYYNLNATVRYTNYLVAKGMVDIVEGWFENLPAVVAPKKKSKFLKDLTQDSFFESFPLNKALINTVCVILPAFAVYRSESLLAKIFGQEAISVSLIILLLAVLWSILYLISTLLFGAITRVSTPRSRHLKLNAGDRRALERYEEKREQKLAKRKLLTNTIIIGFFVSVAASIVVGLF